MLPDAVQGCRPFQGPLPRISGVEAAVRQHKPKIVFLTSPNNPDGSIISEVGTCAPVHAEHSGMQGLPHSHRAHIKTQSCHAAPA